MSGTVWAKFFWADWLSDRGLRRSSYAARGLWMDMLCIAAQGDPIGKLSIEGDPLLAEDIARMTGGSLSETEILIAELERNGVLSRDRNGVIYSRRMVSDAKKAATARKNGKQGGNPSLKKQTQNPASVNPQDKGLLNLISQKPEARSQKEPPPDGGGRAQRGTRLAEGMPLPDDWRQWAIAEGCSEPERVWPKFHDYWIAQPGQRGVKREWFATWRNWVRKEIERAPALNRPANHSGHGLNWTEIRRKAREA